MSLIIKHRYKRVRSGHTAPQEQQGKALGHSPKRRETVCKAPRASRCKPSKADSCKPFIAYVVKQVRERKWTLDARCGCAKRQCLFSENEMVCTHTLYNMVWDGLLGGSAWPADGVPRAEDAGGRIACTHRTAERKNYLLRLECVLLKNGISEQQFSALTPEQQKQLRLNVEAAIAYVISRFFTEDARGQNACLRCIV